MVNNKKLLVLLVAFFIYINGYIPLVDSNEKKVKKLNSYEDKLNKEKAFLKDSLEISDLIAKNELNMQTTSELMYQNQVQNSIIFNSIQTKVNVLAKKYQAKVINIVWGEGYNGEEIAYTVLPFTAILEIEPEDIPVFINELFKGSKVVTIEQIHLIKKRNFVLLNMRINMYKNREKE